MFRVVIHELCRLIHAALEVIVSYSGVLGVKPLFRRVILILGLKEVFHKAIDESRSRPFVSDCRLVERRSTIVSSLFRDECLVLPPRGEPSERGALKVGSYGFSESFLIHIGRYHS